MASSQAAIDSSERVDQASPGAPGQSLNVSSNTPPSSTTSASPPLGASGVSNAYGVPGAAAAGPTQSATTATAVIPTNQHRPPSVKRRVLDALTSQRLWTVVGGICALLSVYSLVKSEKSYALSKWTVRNDALQTCRDTPETERDSYCRQRIAKGIEPEPRIRRALQPVGHTLNGPGLVEDYIGQIDVGAFCVLFLVALAWIMMFWWQYTRSRGLGLWVNPS